MILCNLEEFSKRMKLPKSFFAETYWFNCTNYYTISFARILIARIEPLNDTPCLRNTSFHFYVHSSNNCRFTKNVFCEQIFLLPQCLYMCNDALPFFFMCQNYFSISCYSSPVKRSSSSIIKSKSVYPYKMLRSTSYDVLFQPNKRVDSKCVKQKPYS